MSELSRLSSRSGVSRGEFSRRSRRDHHPLRQSVSRDSFRYRSCEATRRRLRRRTSHAAIGMLSSGKTEPFDDLDRLTPDALHRWWTRKLKRALRVAFEE